MPFAKPAVHTHLSEMGLLHAPSMVRKHRHQHQYQHGGLQHSQSTPLFHSRGGNKGSDASSPWLPRLDNNGGGEIGGNGHRARGQKYSNQHTPLQYSPPRQRGSDAKRHAGRRATQSARGEGGIRNKPYNVLSGRPSGNHNESVFSRRRDAGVEAKQSSRHAKSQPGLAGSDAGGFGSSARRISAESSKSTNTKSRKSKKSGKSRRKRSKERHEQKHYHADDDGKGQTMDGGHSFYDTRAEEEGETGRGEATSTAYQDIDLGSLYANHPSITYIE